VATPIFDFEGKVVASICVAGPRERMTAKKISLLIPALREAAQKITKELGGGAKKLKKEE